MPTVRWQTKNSKVVVDAIEKQTRAQKEQSKTYRESAKEASHLDRTAQQIFRNNEQPLERYKRKMQELGQIMATNRGVTRDLAEREMRRLRQELERADPKVKALADHQRQLATESKRAAAELATQGRRISRELETPVERYKRELLDLGRVYRAGEISQEVFIRGARKLKLELNQVQAAAARTRGELNSNAAAGRRVHGAQALAQVRALAASWVGVGAAIGAATRGIGAYLEEQNKAKQQAQEGRRGVAQLAQLAVTQSDTELGRKAAFASLRDEALQAFESGAASDVNSAANLVFALNSANLGRADRDALVRAQARGLVIDAGAFSTGIAAFQSSFKDLSVDQLVSKSLAISRVAPSQANEVLQEVAKSGAQLRTLGFREDFGLASGAILAKTFKGASEGGTRLDSFLRQFERVGLQNDESLRGLSGVDLIDELARRNIRDNRAELEKVVGNRNEAVQGLRTLIDDRELLRQLTAESRAAGKLNLAGAAVDLAASDPVFAAAERSEVSQRRREAERLRNSEGLSLLQAARNELVTQRRIDDPGFITELKNAYEGFNISTAGLEGNERVANLLREAQDSGKLSDETSAAITGYLSRQADALERIEANQRAARGTTRQE